MKRNIAALALLLIAGSRASARDFPAFVSLGVSSKMQTSGAMERLGLGLLLPDARPQPQGRVHPYVNFATDIKFQQTEINLGLSFSDSHSIRGGYFSFGKRTTPEGQWAQLNLGVRLLFVTLGVSTPFDSKHTGAIFELGLVAPLVAFL